MLRTRYLLGLALLLWPAPAMAQPLFHVEHNWTSTIEGHRYGLWEVVQTPGDFRWTEIWVADCPIRTRHRVAAMVTVIIEPIVRPLANWLRLYGPRPQGLAKMPYDGRD